MALAAAFLGWMFDGLEQGLFPLVARPCLLELLGPIQGPVTEAAKQRLEGEISLWISVTIASFLVGAATGGVLFGWLGDRIGRVRAMTLSVLTYALFSGCCGFATDAWQIALLRFFSALGMGGEWSLGVALVMEIWPDRSRGLMAGLIGAAANFGFLLIALIGLWLGAFLKEMEGWLQGLGVSDDWVDYLLVRGKGWRLLMFVGAAPALLTFLIRLFVPESGRWQKEQRSGTTSHWATRDLLGVLVGALGAGLIIFAWMAELPWVQRIPATLLGLGVAAGGYMYPVIRYLQRSSADRSSMAPSLTVGALDHALRPTLRRMLLGACLGGVALLGTWGAAQWIPTWADKMGREVDPNAKALSQVWSALGAIVGTMAGALVAHRLGRRITYFFLCVFSLGSSLLLYQLNTSFDIAFLASVFLVGCTTAAFYGWLPLYLPELFRTGVRATGQGFSYNFGRILASIGVLQTGNLMKEVYKDNYPAALTVISLIYVVGMAIIWLAPETKGKPLPE
jgi:MFS family permease